MGEREPVVCAGRPARRACSPRGVPGVPQRRPAPSDAHPVWRSAKSGSCGPTSPDLRVPSFSGAFGAAGASLPYSQSASLRRSRTCRPPTPDGAPNSWRGRPASPVPPGSGIPACLVKVVVAANLTVRNAWGHTPPPPAPEGRLDRILRDSPPDKRVVHKPPLPLSRKARCLSVVSEPGLYFPPVLSRPGERGLASWRCPARARTPGGLNLNPPPARIGPARDVLPVRREDDCVSLFYFRQKRIPWL